MTSKDFGLQSHGHPPIGVSLRQPENYLPKDSTRVQLHTLEQQVQELKTLMANLHGRLDISKCNSGRSMHKSTSLVLGQPSHYLGHSEYGCHDNIIRIPAKPKWIPGNKLYQRMAAKSQLSWRDQNRELQTASNPWSQRSNIVVKGSLHLESLRRTHSQELAYRTVNGSGCIQVTNIFEAVALMLFDELRLDSRLAQYYQQTIKSNLIEVLDGPIVPAGYLNLSKYNLSLALVQLRRKLEFSRIHDIMQEYDVGTLLQLVIRHMITTIQHQNACDQIRDPAKFPQGYTVMGYLQELFTGQKITFSQDSYEIQVSIGGKTFTLTYSQDNYYLRCQYVETG